MLQVRNRMGHSGRLREEMFTRSVLRCYYKRMDWYTHSSVARETQAPIERRLLTAS